MFKRVPPDQRHEQKTITITINFSSVMIAVLIGVILIIASISFLTWGQQKVSAADTQAPQVSTADSTSLRRFYRTFDTYKPISTTQACAAGYHFASIWEMLDPSNLEYAGEHIDAWVEAGSDMGEGPFTGGGGFGRAGWARTGYNADGGTTPGQANCMNWTSESSSLYGTLLGLSYEWNVVEDIHVWDVGVSLCDYATGVWCIED